MTRFCSRLGLLKKTRINQQEYTQPKEVVLIAGPKQDQCVDEYQSSSPTNQQSNNMPADRIRADERIYQLICPWEGSIVSIEVKLQSRIEFEKHHNFPISPVVAEGSQHISIGSKPY